MRNKNVWLVFGACIVLGTMSFFITIALMRQEPVTEAPYTAEGAVYQEPAEDTPVLAQKEQKIAPYTKMVYQYYYPLDNITKEVEDVPPYFLLDLTLKEMQKLYEDWTIVSFSSDEVIMRKIMEGKSDERYVLGERDGFVAVFYEEAKDGNMLRELTEIPITALPEEEQARIKEGIPILGDEALAKILADYGS